MRSPSSMHLINIEITNACNMRCSNCTRLCGNHVKPFFMDFETYKRAVDSLEGYMGVVNLMGGEPTLHPEFERFAAYFREKFGSYTGKDRLVNTRDRFVWEIHTRASKLTRSQLWEDGKVTIQRHGPALWSNMGKSYYRHYETIQDTFQIQQLDDHAMPSYHQPALLARKDLGIPDEEWICVYHISGDVLAIMGYLRKIVPEYRFWLRHYGSANTETVLYASVETI